MSYLHGPRISFAGRFFGDVSTINNRPEAYQPSPQPPRPLWNPGGGATFDFLDCQVVGGEDDTGSPMSSDDPTRGLAILGAADRSSAKLVDLDPHWQNSSQLWGLVVRLVDPASGEELLSGSFRVSGFRDLWPRQVGKTEVNRQGAGGSFTSVLDNVVYGPGVAASTGLSALRQVAPTTRLSIVLNVFGYFYTHVDGRFATGSLTGCIGPWQPGEPETFVAGRRIEMGVVHGPSDAPTLLGPSVASIDKVASRLVIDLGNAYPIVDYDGVPASLADLSSPEETVTALEVGVLASEAISADDLVGIDDVTVLGTIDLPQARTRAGVYSFPLDPVAADLAARHPLALLARRPGPTRRVICRETSNGLYVRADEFVQRIDARATGETRATGEVTLYAVQRGEPVPGVTIHLKRPPGAAEGPLTFPTRPVVTDTEGTAKLTLSAADPGSPRGAIDGVVDRIGYAPRLAADGSLDYDGTGLNPVLDLIIAHVREAYDPPAVPEWGRDIQPILAPYARLYPIMREHLVDLSNLDAVRQLRRPMLLALTRDISDPNFMPVTRDLSEAKRAAIIRWLEQLPAVGDDLPPATTDAGVGVGMPTGTAEVAAMDDDPLRFDVKNASAVETGQQVMARHTSRIADNGEK